MKKLQLASATLATLFVSSAFAADLPVKASEQPPAPSFSWTGFYFGGNAGGDWGKSQFPLAATGTNAPFAANVDSNGGGSFDTHGFTGGGQAGYNFQWGNILLGVETDFEYFRSAGSQSVSFNPRPDRPDLFPNLNATVTKSLTTADWLFTARPRAGFVWNNWLFYGTGGVAVTRLKTSWSYVDNFIRPETASSSAAATVIGGTVGGGIEVAFPGDWFIGGEYLYLRFPGVSSSGTFSAGGVLEPGLTMSNNSNLVSNIVRFRLSKKF